MLTLTTALALLGFLKVLKVNLQKLITKLEELISVPNYEKRGMNKHSISHSKTS